MCGRLYFCDTLLKWPPENFKDASFAISGATSGPASLTHAVFYAKTSGPNSNAMCMRLYISHLRRVSHAYNLASVLNLNTFVDFAVRVMTG